MRYGGWFTEEESVIGNGFFKECSHEYTPKIKSLNDRGGLD